MEKPMRILVADDEPTARMLMSAALKKAGYEVHAARHGVGDLRTGASWRDAGMLRWLDAMGFEPRLSPRCDHKLIGGEVLTVEPGVYYPEWGGIRLEDMVFVTSDGCKCLTGIETFLEIE